MLYESYVHPITILSTLPSAGVGAVLALLLFHMDFSLIALIGVILLIGIVKKNAIMMIDVALSLEREENMDSRDAIYTACLRRFRPIVMTTIAAMLGAAPLALINGEGGELRRPLGISIVGGLLFSQMLTLYTTPVVYLYLDRARLRQWPARRGTLVRRLVQPAEKDRDMTTCPRKRPICAGFRVSPRRSTLAGCTVGPNYHRPDRDRARRLQGRPGLAAGEPGASGEGDQPGGRCTTIRCSTSWRSRSRSPTKT